MCEWSENMPKGYSEGVANATTHQAKFLELMLEPATQ